MHPRRSKKSHTSQIQDALERKREVLAQNALTEREASRYTGFSPSFFRQDRMDGPKNGPPFVKIGRAVRYLRTDLDAWLEAHRVSRTAR